jgi:hypothetical protein
VKRGPPPGAALKGRAERRQRSFLQLGGNWRGFVPSLARAESNDRPRSFVLLVSELLQGRLSRCTSGSEDSNSALDELTGTYVFVFNRATILA